MTNTDTAAAHVVTSDAVALGDPEIIIMTEADETGAADEIQRIELSPSYGMEGAVYNLPDHGWMTTGQATEVETGYWIVPVIRSH